MKRIWCLLALWALNWVTDSGVSYAQTFTPSRPACYFSAYAWALGSLPDGSRTAVWYCKTPTGLKRYSRSEDVPHSMPVMLTAPEDVAAWAIDSRLTTRRHTDEELALVSQLHRTHAPRCTTFGTTTGPDIPVYVLLPDGTRGPARTMRVLKGQWAACSVWVQTSSTVQYCEVGNRPDTAGNPIPPGSVARCRIDKAPPEGWEPA